MGLGLGRRSTLTRSRVDSAGAWRRAVAWAAGIVADERVVYLDTETTGLGPDDEIVDLAIVGAGGEVLLDSLVRPSRPIPPGASAVHGLTDADVAFAPPWELVYPHLLEALSGRIVVVYNADFDRRLVGQCCGRSRLPEPSAEWNCAMRVYADFHGEPGRGGGFRWHRLEHAAATFGLPPGGHRALGDARTCRMVVHGMAAFAGEASGVGHQASGERG
jgi:DNA polymerase III subunit epsilon